MDRKIKNIKIILNKYPELIALDNFITYMEQECNYPISIKNVEAVYSEFFRKQSNLLLKLRKIKSYKNEET